MNYPTPFELAMIATHSARKTSREKAEAALELWSECQYVLYKKQKADDEAKEYEEAIGPQEAQTPRSEVRYSIDDFLRKFHPRKKTKTMPKMRKDYNSWLSWLLHMTYNKDCPNDPLSDHYSPECPEDCPFYRTCQKQKVMLDIDGGIKARLGGDFIWWYNRNNSLKKSVNGRKGVVAKKLKHVQKSVK